MTETQLSCKTEPHTAQLKFRYGKRELQSSCKQKLFFTKAILLRNLITLIACVRLHYAKNH